MEKVPFSGAELKYWGRHSYGKEICASLRGCHQGALATSGKNLGNVHHKVVSVPQLEKCAQDLGSTSKAVGSSMAQLLTCAAQGNEDYTGTNAFGPLSRAAPGEARGAGITALPSHLTSGVWPMHTTKDLQRQYCC